MTDRETGYQCANCGQPLEVASGTFDDIFTTTIAIEPCENCMAAEWQKGVAYANDRPPSDD